MIYGRVVDGQIELRVTGYDAAILLSERIAEARDSAMHERLRKRMQRHFDLRVDAAPAEPVRSSGSIK